MGLNNICDLIDQATQDGQIVTDTVTFCQTKFSQVLELSKNKEGGVPFARSDLMMPMLSHIPNLKSVTEFQRHG